MRLLAHPAAPCGPVRHLDVDAQRGPDGQLRLAWRLEADLSQLRLPAAAAPNRADALWRHTCFEAFIAVPPSTAYCELNFSPSGEWSAYSFNGYRTGMMALHVAAPAASWRQGAGQLALHVVMPLRQLLPVDGVGDLRLALCAVIEDRSGTISYWALRHPPGKPDFHHPDGFVLELPSSNAAAGGEIEGT